jgi:hypothetical protein
MVFAYVKALTRRKLVGDYKVFCQVLHTFQDILFALPIVIHLYSVSHQTELSISIKAVF